VFCIVRIQLTTLNNPQFCSNCLYDNKHPFGLSFQEGVCSGCFTHSEKDTINWGERESLLVDLISQTRKNKKSHYDCVVPVQGDAEDYYVVSKVLALNLNPLIVCVNDYYMNNIGWHNLHNLITHFDLDSLVYNPEINTYKEMVRTTLRKLDHILWPSIALKSSFPVHIAKERNIPLVVWGQNQAIEQVGKFSHTDSVEMSKWSRKEHDLFGYDVDKVIGSGAQIDIRNLNYYRYPNIKNLGHSKVKGIYLSNYFRWDPLYQNKKSVVQGFVPQHNSASFDIYERAGSSVYYEFHDLLKLQRVGYRKVRDQLSREVRHGRLDRQSALELENHYNKSEVDISGFFNWLGVTKSGVEWFVSKRLPKVKHLIGSSENKICQLPADISGLLTNSDEPTREFVLFGKGVSL